MMMNRKALLLPLSLLLIAAGCATGSGEGEGDGSGAERARNGNLSREGRDVRSDDLNRDTKPDQWIIDATEVD